MTPIVALLVCLAAVAAAVAAPAKPTGPATPEPAAAVQTTTIRALGGQGTVSFPYPAGSGLVLGSGFDASGLGTAHTRGAIDPNVETMTNPGTNGLHATTFLATSGTDVNDKLSISSKASMSYGAFSANTEVKFSQSIDRSARAMSLVAEYDIAFAQTMYSAQPTLSAAAKALLTRPGGGVQAFARAYGQYYVYAITTGSKLLARSTITSSREEMITSLSVQADASGSYGAFSASVSTAVAKDQSIQSFSTTEETSVSAEGVDFSCLYPSGGAAPAPSPAAIDAVIAQYKECTGRVSAAGHGVPSTMVLARFDELPEWTWGPLAPVNSIFDDNSALRDAAGYVAHYDGVMRDASAYMNQPGASPDTSAKLLQLNTQIRAAKNQIVAALATSNEQQLEALLATLPFWATFQAQYNRIVGDYKWSSCDWRTVSNNNGGGQSQQLCPSPDTVAIVGGTHCRPELNRRLVESRALTDPKGLPIGWYSQCKTEQDMSAGSDLYLTSCYKPLLGSCSPLVGNNAFSLECPAGQVLIGAGATCDLNDDQNLAQLEPWTLSKVAAHCLHWNGEVHPATAITGQCCTLPDDATATLVRATPGSGDPTAVQCPSNSVLVNGGVLCPQAAPGMLANFILHSFPSSRTSWAGGCINNYRGIQMAPQSTSAVCVSFSEDQTPPTAPPTAHAMLRATPAPANATRRATATEAFNAHTGLTLSLAQPKRLAHFALEPAPAADVTLHFHATCNVVLGASGSVVVRSDGRCVADLTHGTITIPRGLHTASVQIVRAGAGGRAGARFAAKQSGSLEFVGRVASADPAWDGRSASIFAPVRITITD